MLSFHNAFVTKIHLKTKKLWKCPLLRSVNDSERLHLDVLQIAVKNLLPLQPVSSRLTNTVFQRTPAIRPTLEHINYDKDVLFLTISLTKMLSMRSCRAWNILWAFQRNARDCWLPKQALIESYVHRLIWNRKTNEFSGASWSEILGSWKQRRWQVRYEWIVLSTTSICSW